MRSPVVIPIVAADARPPARATRLSRFGDAMQRHRGTIQGIQWAVVGIYVVLLVVPVWLPLPPAGASMLSDFRLAAQFIFWGLWWPFVIVSVMLVGRAWCGVFCPEGALTEFASRHGLGRSIPRWLRWGGWPVVAFVATTVYGQLISVYDYPRAALLILGGSTVAAVGVGLVYGQGRRVWCRYLCPVTGVFALLAQLAPLHFRADAAAWRGHRGPVPRVDCAPLLNLRALDSAAACHACGRCSGHRGAIALAARSPNAEALSPAPAAEVSPVLLVFGLLGVAVGAFQWSASPWFVMAKQAAAEWLVGHGWYALLDDGAPWWLLTHQPEASDVFSWLDGLLILVYIGGYAGLAGGLAWLALLAAARLLGGAASWRRLAAGLVPLAGIGLFLGLSMTTVTHLRAEGASLGWVGPLRGGLLALALGWSLWLAWRLVRQARPTGWRALGAFLLCGLPVALTGAVWGLLLFVW